LDGTAEHIRSLGHLRATVWKLRYLREGEQIAYIGNSDSGDKLLDRIKESMKKPTQATGLSIYAAT
jgi:hypothetical protein